MKFIKVAALLLVVVVLCGSLAAQDAREALGPQDRPQAKNNKEPHPLTKLMASVNASLRPELMRQHPRVYVTEAELVTLRQRAQTTHKELWQQVLSNVRALRGAPAPAPAQERRAQNNVALALAEAAFVYKIEGDPKYLAAAKQYMDAAVSYDVWGYTYNKPNVDLAAGHLLYGLGYGYDLLYNDLTAAERLRYRTKLIKQAQLLAEYYTLKPGRTFSYSQNHVFIPLAGLGVAAYALYDETPEAPQWAKLVRAVFDRVLATYSTDGYYYEGFEYWIFSTPWLIHYLDAQAHCTGEDLYDRPGFRSMHEYVAHSMLPNGNYVFDFGDIFEGPLTRAGKGEDYKRTHPGGHFATNYNLLYRLAQRFRSGAAQGVAQQYKEFGQVNAEDYWSLLWYEPSLKAVPLEKQPTWHYFSDHEVFYWRSDWTKNATAFAFKCGPPEGHHTSALLEQFPDWHLSSGHAHPDANSFIIFARGQYLTGDTGYAGVPMTEHHNTLLINGKGQAAEGSGHDAFAEFPYPRLNQVRILDVKVEPNRVVIRGDATAAYQEALGLKKFVRAFTFSKTEGFTVTDEIQTAAPAIFTTLLHADTSFTQENVNQFSINIGSVKLLAEILLPRKIKTTLEPNTLTAAGRPGAVDQGERQERGEKLLLTTIAPNTKAQFALRLRLAN